MSRHPVPAFRRCLGVAPVLTGAFLSLALGGCHRLDHPAAPEAPPCEGPLCLRPLLDQMGVHPFYQKFITGGGIAILSSEKVRDDALYAAAEIVENMVGDRTILREALRNRGVYVAVIGRTERLTDIPEYYQLPDSLNDTQRGLPGYPQRPITTVGEENLLCDAQDMFRGESMLIRHFAVTVAVMAIDFVDSDFWTELEGAFNAAHRDGLWLGTDADSNPDAYWGEGVQSWYDANVEPMYGVDTREELKAHDPWLADLVAESFADGTWRWTCPARPG